MTEMCERSIGRHWLTPSTFQGRALHFLHINGLPWKVDGVIQCLPIDLSHISVISMLYLERWMELSSVFQSINMTEMCERSIGRHWLTPSTFQGRALIWQKCVNYALPWKVDGVIQCLPIDLSHISVILMVYLERWMELSSVLENTG
jgi:hypothetical protein